MKKITLSVAALGLVVNANAAEALAAMFSEGKASGQIREYSVDREYQGSAGNTTHRKANAIGGYLKFDTADYKGLSFGTAFYTTNGFLNNSDVTNTALVDETLFGPNNSNISYVGELYVNFKYKNTSFKGGRQKINTPMAAADDARMLPDLFEAYMLTNTDIKDTKITLGHITKFNQGTFGRVYAGFDNVFNGTNEAAARANALLSVTSGYSYFDADNQAGSFESVGKYAFKKESAGVTVAALEYTGVENLKLQLWDYYFHDVINTVYAQADYSFGNVANSGVKPYVAGQLIKQNSVGDEIAGDVDSLYVAAKVGAKIENFNAYVAYSTVGKNSESEKAVGTANAVITPLGGIPAFTQGMVTRHMFLAGTDASKVAASYNFTELAGKLLASAYYTSFNMDANSGYGIARTASESGFDMIYNPELVKNLEVRVRGNFPRDFFENASGSTGWDEYRLIVNYNF